jgi:hypothetical protein
MNDNGISWLNNNKITDTHLTGFKNLLGVGLIILIKLLTTNFIAKRCSRPQKKRPFLKKGRFLFFFNNPLFYIKMLRAITIF